MSDRSICDICHTPMGGFEGDHGIWIARCPKCGQGYNCETDNIKMTEFCKDPLNAWTRGYEVYFTQKSRNHAYERDHLTAVFAQFDNAKRFAKNIRAEGEKARIELYWIDARDDRHHVPVDDDGLIVKEAGA